METVITIPPTNGHFSLFAEGELLSVFSMGPGRESFVTLEDEHPINLFYKINGRRYLYICTSVRDMEYLPVYNFKEVSSPLRVMTVLHGRAYDRYKRSLSYLKKKYVGKSSRFRSVFFMKLAALCKNGMNSNSNIEILADKEMVNDEK